MGKKMTKAQSRAYTADIKVAFNIANVIKFNKHFTTGDERQKAIDAAQRIFRTKRHSIASETFDMVSAVERSSGIKTLNGIKSNGVQTFEIDSGAIWTAVNDNGDKLINGWIHAIASLRVIDGVGDTIDIAIDAIIGSLMRDDGATINAMGTAAANAIVTHSAYIATLGIITKEGNKERVEQFTKGYRGAGRNGFTYVMAARARVLGEEVIINKDGYPSYKADKGEIGTARSFSKAIVTEFMQLHGDLIESNEKKTERFTIKESAIESVYTAVKAKQMGRKHSLAFINEDIPDIVDSGIGGGLNIGTRFDSVGGTFNVISGGRQDHGDTSAVRDACNTRQRNGVVIDTWVLDNAAQFMADWDAA